LNGSPKNLIQLPKPGWVILSSLKKLTPTSSSSGARKSAANASASGSASCHSASCAQGRPLRESG